MDNLNLYHNNLKYSLKTDDLNNFLQEDDKWNKKAGIIELDITIKNLKEKLNKILDKIINNEIVDIKL